MSWQWLVTRIFPLSSPPTPFTNGFVCLISKLMLDPKQRLGRKKLQSVCAQRHEQWHFRGTKAHCSILCRFLTLWNQLYKRNAPKPPPGAATVIQFCCLFVCLFHLWMTWKPLSLLGNSNKTEICLSQKHASLLHEPLITQTVLPVLVNIYIWGGVDIHTHLALLHYALLRLVRKALQCTEAGTLLHLTSSGLLSTWPSGPVIPISNILACS